MFIERRRGAEPGGLSDRKSSCRFARSRAANQPYGGQSRVFQHALYPPAGRPPARRPRSAPAPPVIVVNQAFRRRFFPNQDPVGSRISIGVTDHPVWLEIVGVVGDIRQNGLDRDAEPWFYQSYLQGPAVRRSASHGNLDPRFVRFSVLAFDSCAGSVTSIDPDQPVYDVKTMEQRLAGSLSSRRFNATVWIAMLRRGRDPPRRHRRVRRHVPSGDAPNSGNWYSPGAGSAAGAEVLHLIVREGFVLAIAGSVIGLAGACALRRSLSMLLFGVSTLDPAIYSGCTAALLIAVLAAC